jgi:hypothetical protein
MDNDKSPNGVDGWLLLFVVLKFLSPVFFLLSLLFLERLRHRIAPMHSGAQPAVHAVTISPALHLVLMIVTITTILVMLTGVLAAIGILLRSRWALTAVALNLVLSTFSALMPFVQPGHQRPAMLYRELALLAMLLIWIAYFSVSKRVRNTLGHNLFRSPLPNQS